MVSCRATDQHLIEIRPRIVGLDSGTTRHGASQQWARTRHEEQALLLLSLKPFAGTTAGHSSRLRHNGPEMHDQYPRLF
jgi:hypothetical protein